MNDQSMQNIIVSNSFRNESSWVIFKLNFEMIRDLRVCHSIFRDDSYLPLLYLSFLILRDVGRRERTEMGKKFLPVFFGLFLPQITNRSAHLDAFEQTKVFSESPFPFFSSPRPGERNLGGKD